MMELACRRYLSDARRRKGSSGERYRDVEARLCEMAIKGRDIFQAMGSCFVKCRIGVIKSDTGRNSGNREHGWP